MRRRSVASAIAALLVASCSSSSGPITRSPSPSTAPTSPAARGYASLVDASGDEGVYLFGGWTGPPRKGGKRVPDLWSFRYGGGWLLVGVVADEVPVVDSGCYS